MRDLARGKHRSVAIIPTLRLRTLVFRVSVALAAAGVASGCSSPSAPKPQPTLLVVNATCEPGPCQPLLIRAFIEEFHIPQMYWGLKYVGMVSGPSRCFVFPEAWPLVVTHQDSTGRTVTDTSVWNPDNSEGIYLWAGIQDSAITVGETPVFVPGISSGWSVTFPGGAGAPGLATSPSCPDPEQMQDQ